METIDDKNYAEIAALRAELARLKSEKEAAERERKDAKEQLQTVHSHVAEALSLLGVDISVNGYIPDSWTLREQCHIAKAQLTAATSRAEALATGIESIHYGRIVLSQADNGEWGAVLGTRIVTGCETAAEAVLAALLQPAKEVEGGK